MFESTLLLYDGRRRALSKAWKALRRSASPDAVHDARVASRRMIATLDMLKKFARVGAFRKARRRLRSRLKMLGPLRDVHVHRKLARGLAPKAFLEDLVVRERRLVRALEISVAPSGEPMLQAVRERLRRALRDPEALERRVRRALDKTYARVAALSERVDPADTATIHRLRVAFKKFRYTAETAEPISTTPEQFAAMSDLQTAMGAVNDVETLVQALLQFGRRARVSTDTAVHELLRKRAHLVGAFMRLIDRIPALRPGRAAPTLELFLLRHAEATPKEGDDAARPLTTAGERQAEAAAKGMRALGVRPGRVITSPYIRARATAAAIEPDATESDKLLPEADPDDMIEELNRVRAGSVLLVGHEPHLGRLVRRLIGCRSSSRFEFEKAGLCKLAFQGGTATLQWLLTRAQLSRLGQGAKETYLSGSRSNISLQRSLQK